MIESLETAMVVSWHLDDPNGSTQNKSIMCRWFVMRNPKAKRSQTGSNGPTQNEAVMCSMCRWFPNEKSIVQRGPKQAQMDLHNNKNKRTLYSDAGVAQVLIGVPEARGPILA